MARPTAPLVSQAASVLIVSARAGMAEVIRSLLFSAGIRGPTDVVSPPMAAAELACGAYAVVAVDLADRSDEGGPPLDQLARAAGDAKLLVFARPDEALAALRADLWGVASVLLTPAAPAAVRRRLAATPGAPVLFLDD